MDLVKSIEHKIEWVEGDVLDVVFLQDAMKGVDQVYHCAAVVSFDARDFAMMRQVNVEGTANVVNTALYEGVEKLVHVSSIAAVGRPEIGHIISEQTRWQRSKNNTQYSISKYQSEHEVWRGHAEGLNMAIVNPSVILGAGFWAEGPLKFFQLGWKEFPFYSEGQTGFVDVRDVADFMIRLMESEVSGQRYILNSESSTYKDFMFAISDELGKKRPYIKVNRLIQEIVWRFEWVRSRLFGGSPLITRETARISGKQYEYKADKSVEQFDFEYRPLRQTIHESAQLFKEAAKQEDCPPKVLPLQ